MSSRATQPRFIPGLHQPSDVVYSDKLSRAFISINRVRGRMKPLPGIHVIDSGAFREIAQFGGYRHGPAEYAAELRRLHEGGIVRIEIAVAQDYMCEDFMLIKTALADGVELAMDWSKLVVPMGKDEEVLVREVSQGDRERAAVMTREQRADRVRLHQRLTIERYDALLAEEPPCPIMPVLQGFRPDEYVAHVDAYGDRLRMGMWVGVGSVCKRNGDPAAIIAVLSAVKQVRPDLRLHGFGLKTTSLLNPLIRDLLHSADSMAWSFAARRQGRDGNDWREAVAFYDRITCVIGSAFEPYQLPLFAGLV